MVAGACCWVWSTGQAGERRVAMGMKWTRCAMQQFVAATRACTGFYSIPYMPFSGAPAAAPTQPHTKMCAIRIRASCWPQSHRAPSIDMTDLAHTAPSAVLVTPPRPAGASLCLPCSSPATYLALHRPTISVILPLCGKPILRYLLPIPPPRSPTPSIPPGPHARHRPAGWRLLLLLRHRRALPPGQRRLVLRAARVRRGHPHARHRTAAGAHRQQAAQDAVQDAQEDQVNGETPQGSRRSRRRWPGRARGHWAAPGRRAVHNIGRGLGSGGGIGGAVWVTVPLRQHKLLKSMMGSDGRSSVGNGGRVRVSAGGRKGEGGGGSGYVGQDASNAAIGAHVDGSDREEFGRKDRGGQGHLERGGPMVAASGTARDRGGC